MLFLIEEKLFGLVYTCMYLSMKPWPVIICDLQNVSVNISCFENYQKKDSKKRNWGWTVFKNYHYNILLITFDLVHPHVYHNNNYCIYWETQRLPHCLGWVLLFTYFTQSGDHIIWLFFMEQLLYSAHGDIHLLIHSHQVLTIKANHPKRLSILLNLDPSRKVYKKIVKSKC